MSDFFQRAYTLNVDGHQVDKLRIQFEVKNSLEKEPSPALIRIFNLGEDLRGKLKKKNMPVELIAGYVDSKAIIYRGDSRTTISMRKGPDWITEIACGDGERAYTSARLNTSLPKGTSKSDVIRKTAESFGINVGNLETFASKVKGEFRKGFAANGNAAQVMTDLLESSGLKWSIQNGELQIRNDDDPVSNEAVLLSSETGMIGSPEMGSPSEEKKRNHVKARSYLNHKIRCGHALELRSNTVTGHFRVESCEHQGDSEGTEWFTSMELKAL